MCNKGFTITACVLLALNIVLSVSVPVEAITWSLNTKQLTTYEFYDGYPAFLQAEDGRMWFVWSKEIAGNLTLFYKTTSNLGRTWSNEMNLTNMVAQGQNQNPSIIQAQNGTIWIAWTSDRPPPPAPPMPDFSLDASPQNLTILQGESCNSTIIVTSTNNFNGTVNLTVLNEPAGVTTNLNPTQVVPPANGTANSNLTISVDLTATPGNYTLTVMGKASKLIHNINIHLEIAVAGGASQTHTKAHVDLRSHLGSNLLHPRKLLLSPSTTSATPTEIYDYEIYYKTSHDNGATWSKDIQLTSNTVDDLRPSIIQLTNGTIILFWQTHISGSFNIVYTTTTDGISWSSTTQLTTDSAHDRSPAATQTKDEKIWVTWSSPRTGDTEIWYKFYDGFSWSNDTRLTYSTNMDIGPAILQAVNEEILIFWASNPDISTDEFGIYYKYSANGSSWSESIEFAAGSYDDMWPAIIQTRDMKIWVAWNSETEFVENGQTYTNMDVYCKTSLPADVNNDNEVNDLDLAIVSASFGYYEGEPEYNPDADINKDGTVDMEDLVIVTYYIG